MTGSRIPFSRTSRTPGFTLVELLTVIGIVTLLLAVLLPSLARARQQARATLCAVHLRQIATGWNIYAHQYRDVAVAGRFPRLDTTDNPRANLYFVGNGWKYRARWFAVLGAQVGLYAYRSPSPDPAEDNTQPVDGEVFLDPAVPERNNTRNYTYGYNFQFLGNSRLKEGGREGDWINWPVRLDRIRSASGTVMAADAMGTAASTPARDRLPYDPTGLATDPRRLGNHAWSLDPPRLTPDGDFCDNNLRNEARSAPEPRHAGRANAVFTDGHVERLHPERLGYVVRDDGTVPLHGEGANQAFSGTGRDDDPPVVR